MYPSNFKFVIESKPEEVESWMLSNYTYQVPAQITTAEEMQKASMLMSSIINAYSYLQSLAASVSIMTTNIKGQCTNKPDTKASQEIKDNYEKIRRDYVQMSQKKKVIETQADILSKQYTCISRMVTIKLKADEEMHMSDIRYNPAGGGYR